MSDVIDFESEKIKRGTHKSGPVICLNCNHEWVAVSPIEVISLECPKCHTFKGVFRGLASTEFRQWQCKCGSFFFFLDEKGAYCSSCCTRPQDYQRS